ncbi:MAG: DUF4296 domain-containing protein [Sphingobacteriaceae bacterium]|nr:DUF4296 domain-containing protein [Cytophagaceae bacterium]
MNTKVIIPAVLLLLLACQTDPERPNDLIPKEKMALILRDIHLGEQRVSGLGLRSQDSAMVVFQTLERRIYKKYGCDTAAYRRSYFYYASRPEQFQEIYRAVGDSLQKMEDRLKVKPVGDSLRPK